MLHVLYFLLIDSLYQYYLQSSLLMHFIVLITTHNQPIAEGYLIVYCLICH